MDRQKVINYYDELKNKVDILIEKEIFKDQSKAQELNSNRQIIIEKIEDICKSNLEYIKNQSEPISSLFGPNYCYIESDKYTTLKLIVLNQYLKRWSLSDIGNVLDSLKRKILSKLISSYSNKSSNIIDLTNPEQNIIEKFKFVLCEDYSTNDLNVFKSLINVGKIKSFKIKICRQLDDYFFSPLQSLKKLQIDINSDLKIERKCFDGLQLEEFVINGDESEINFDISILNCLINLKKLTITSLNLNNFKTRGLVNLKNLEFLFITGCQIDNLKSGCFKGLTSLKIFNLRSNEISKIGKNVFNDVKNLLYLNLNNCDFKKFDIEWFNRLDNLEYLALSNLNKDNGIELDLELKYKNLRLENLKYLEIDSIIIPTFEHLQLEFLQINNLLAYQPQHLDNQTKLKGLCLKVPINMFNKFKKMHFSCFNLKYLEFDWCIPYTKPDDFDNFKPEKIKSFLKKRNVHYLNECFSIAVSTYQEKNDFIENEISFSEETNEAFIGECFNFDYYDDYFEF